MGFDPEKAFDSVFPFLKLPYLQPNTPEDIISFGSPDAGGFLDPKHKKIPDEFIALFWDTELSAIDIKKNARHIIERVLEMGGMDAVQWIQRIYPTKIIIEVCESSRKVSLKSRNFWRIWFGYKYGQMVIDMQEGVEQ